MFSITGLGLIWRRARREPWSRFLIYGFAVSIVPASLTNDVFHMLRLIAVPVFLLVFAIPGIIWFTEKSRRAIFTVLIGLTILEATWFQWNYHRTAGTARRIHLFDAEYPTKIFEPALKSSANPIYLADALWIPGYIQAYWYSALNGIDLSRFHRLPSDQPVPLGGFVISTEENCPGCEILGRAAPVHACDREGTAAAARFVAARSISRRADRGCNPAGRAREKAGCGSGADQERQPSRLAGARARGRRVSGQSR